MAHHAGIIECICQYSLWLLSVYLFIFVLFRNTHIYGRHLVLEWAKEDDTVAELREKTAEHYRTTHGPSSSVPPAKKSKLAADEFASVSAALGGSQQPDGEFDDDRVIVDDDDLGGGGAGRRKRKMR